LKGLRVEEETTLHVFMTSIAQPKELMSLKQPANYRQPAPTGNDTFKTFEDLEVYRLSREFRKAMYRVAKQLPDFEKFGLASQIRRASVSLTNNVAEGHGRFHYLEQIKFTLIARGSLEELIDDINVCTDENYLPSAEVNQLKSDAWHIHRVMAGYLRYLRERKQGASLALHESSPAYGLTDDDLDALLADSAPSSTL
jgi:four helix bundle protein